jgi:hypothetical protein
MGWPPKPVSETLCMLFAVLLLLSVKTREAVSIVAVDGVNVTFTVQVLALGGNPIIELFVQVVPLAIMKSCDCGLGPPAAIEKLVNCRVKFPEFVNVAGSAAVVLVTRTGFAAVPNVNPARGVAAATGAGAD